MNNSNLNPFQEQENSPQENTDNQPALEMPRVDHQRDMGSGLNAGTAPGTTSADPYQYQGEQSVGPGSDPHAGAGYGTGIDAGQYRGSDDGTSTDAKESPEQ